MQQVTLRTDGNAVDGCLVVTKYSSDLGQGVLVGKRKTQAGGENRGRDVQ
jgi:hypothetical protein